MTKTNATIQKDVLTALKGKIPLRITLRAQLVALAQALGTRHDWHEPDEQGLTVEVRGKCFDSCGFWGRVYHAFSPNIEEFHVVLLKDGKPVAEANLADLFAFACGTYEGF